jgi:hypothetical protein
MVPFLKSGVEEWLDEALDETEGVVEEWLDEALDETEEVVQLLPVEISVMFPPPVVPSLV